jgi:cytidylate kinase
MAKDTKVIACDGPARAGKTTLALNFEQKLGVPRISTGNIYRALSMLLLSSLKVDSLKDIEESKLVEALYKHNVDNLRVNFSGEVFLGDDQFTGLTAPRISANAWVASRVQEFRTNIVEPLVVKMVDECPHPVVFSEGRDEGRLWKEANRLGIAVFLSVDPLVGAIREREMRITQKQEVISLREIMSSLMRYDLDNASRGVKPTYVDDELTVFTGKMTKDIKQAIAKQHQIVVPTSSLDIPTVFQRVVRLAQQAKLLNTKDIKQISLLEV